MLFLECASDNLDSKIDSLDVYPTDPYLYKNKILSNEKIRDLISLGPCQPGLFDEFRNFPPDTNNRKFQTYWYRHGTSVRSWLIYSPRCNKMFCFSCWLFSKIETATVWANPQKGFCNFKKGLEKIKLHEESHAHRELQNKFVITKLRILKNSTVINEQLRAQKNEVIKNRESLKRFLDIILFLAKQNLPLRGHLEYGDSNNKGNFLELVNLIKKYDVTLAEHLSNTSKVSKYTSPTIQNELLHFISTEVLTKIVSEIRNARYYSLIVDSTLDITKKEQLSLSFRYVNKRGYPEERFVKFIEMSSGSAKTYFNIIISELKLLDISLQLCRGQAYDGASTMSGAISGLKTRIQEHVPEALYVHCCAHNLNLALVDSVTSCAEIKLFFGTLEQIYVYITESFPRLKLFQTIQTEVVQDNTKLTLKKLSVTRWASHKRAVDSCFQNIVALEETCEKILSGEITNTTAKQMAEASGILNTIQTLEFKFLLCFWKGVLDRIFALSNYLQKSDLNVKTAANLVNAAQKDLISLRNDVTFSRFKTEALVLANKCHSSQHFSEKRKRTVKHFHDEIESDYQHENMEQKFKITVFYVALDTFIETLKTRFKDFIEVSQKFDCLLSENLEATDSNIKCIMDLVTFYKDDLTSHTVDEYKSFCSCMLQVKKENGLTTEEILPFIIANDLESVYPSMTNLYKIFYTLATNSAGAERSFSRLRKIKAYQRTTIGEQRLNDLALISIESECAMDVDFNIILDKMKCVKTRRLAF